MDQIRDAICHDQMARVARRKAELTDDPFLARRLREDAVRHKRMAPDAPRRWRLPGLGLTRYPR